MLLYEGEGIIENAESIDFGFGRYIREENNSDCARLYCKSWNMKTEKISSGISNLFVLVIVWEFVVKGFTALKFLHERGDRTFNITFDLRRHFENKRGVFWDTFLLHLSYELHVMVSMNKIVSYHAHFVLYLLQEIELILSRTTSCICRFCCIERLYGRFP